MASISASCSDGTPLVSVQRTLLDSTSDPVVYGDFQQRTWTNFTSELMVFSVT